MIRARQIASVTGLLLTVGALSLDLRAHPEFAAPIQFGAILGLLGALGGAGFGMAVALYRRHES